MPQYDATVKQADPVQIVTGVVELWRSGMVCTDAKAWAMSCSNSGQCIPACPEGINPRKMLALARLTLHQQGSADELQTAQQAARDNFTAMGEAIRLLLGVQLSPEDIQRLLPGAISQRQRPAEVVFYFGCNILKTPDIALTVLDVLDAVDELATVHGGGA